MKNKEYTECEFWNRCVYRLGNLCPYDKDKCEHYKYLQDWEELKETRDLARKIKEVDKRFSQRTKRFWFK